MGLSNSIKFSAVPMMPRDETRELFETIADECDGSITVTNMRVADMHVFSGGAEMEITMRVQNPDSLQRIIAASQAALRVPDYMTNGYHKYAVPSEVQEELAGQDPNAHYVSSFSEN